MKEDLEMTSYKKFTLYIPHGSDESVPVPFSNLTYQIFISHMVQMKEYLDGITSLSTSALYPTWFR